VRYVFGFAGVMRFNRGGFLKDWRAPEERCADVWSYTRDFHQWYSEILSKCNYNFKNEINILF